MKRRILIIEDQAILGMELELVLSDAGHSVVGIAVNSPQALALAHETKPELAIIDVNLKDGRTGPTIAQAMVSDFGVTVLFATAEPESLPEQFAGAFGVVVKPYSAATLRTAVDYCLALRDGVDPGPLPSQLHLAPWLYSQREEEGLN